MPTVPLPIFDHQRCRSTGNCVAACPTQCLDMWNDLPWLKYPSLCVSCGLCALVCPTSAIAVAEPVSGKGGGAAPR